MGLLGIVLIFLACGVATFPLTILAVRLGVSVAAPARATPRFHHWLDQATVWSLTGWILCGMIFYATMVMIERTKPCDDQRTNQLTAFCKTKLGAVPTAR